MERFVCKEFGDTETQSILIQEATEHMNWIRNNTYEAERHLYAFSGLEHSYNYKPGLTMNYSGVANRIEAIHKEEAAEEVLAIPYSGPPYAKPGQQWWSFWWR